MAHNFRVLIEIAMGLATSSELASRGEEEWKCEYCYGKGTALFAFAYIFIDMFMSIFISVIATPVYFFNKVAESMGNTPLSYIPSGIAFILGIGVGTVSGMIFVAASIVSYGMVWVAAIHDFFFWAGNWTIRIPTLDYSHKRGQVAKRERGYSGRLGVRILRFFDTKITRVLQHNFVD